MKTTSQRSDVSPNTITRAERGDPINGSTLRALRMTFEAAGVEFIEDIGAGPGVRLRNR